MKQLGREHWWYRGILAAFAVAYVVAGFLLPVVLGIDLDLFGLDRLRAFGPFVPLVLAFIAMAWLGLQGLDLSRPAAGLRAAVAQRPRTAAVLGGLAMIGLGWILRTHYYSGDAQGFWMYFEYFVPRQGFYMRHDEIWEFVLHSKAWQYGNRWFGWGVIEAYQVVNCLASGLVVGLLALVAREYAPTRPVWFVALFVTGGWVQLYFGDPENYTMTSLWLLLYFVMSARHIKGRVPLVAPAAVLAMAMTFHMLAGFLLPALGWLGLRALRDRRFAELRQAVLVFVFIIFITFFLFHFLGIPVNYAVKKAYIGGFGGQYDKLFVAPSWAYHSQILQLMLLLCPCLLLLVPLALHRRITWDGISVHLAISGAGMLFFILFWHSIVGILSDWALYSAFALPVSLLIWRAFVEGPGAQARLRYGPAFLVIFGTHTVSWILGNHWL